MIILKVNCRGGGIGRRARLKLAYRKVWGFESPLRHNDIINHKKTPSYTPNKKLAFLTVKLLL